LICVQNIPYFQHKSSDRGFIMRLELAVQWPIWTHLVSVFRTKAKGPPRNARNPHITERMARDIGLSPAERERLNWQPPSERIRHPML
jgi:hypothetical protein